VFFKQHRVGHSCTNVIRGHCCSLGHSCINVVRNHVCTTVCSSKYLSSHCCATITPQHAGYIPPSKNTTDRCGQTHKMFFADARVWRQQNNHITKSWHLHKTGWRSISKLDSLLCDHLNVSLQGYTKNYAKWTFWMHAFNLQRMYSLRIDSADYVVILWWNNKYSQKKKWLVLISRYILISVMSGEKYTLHSLLHPAAEFKNAASSWLDTRNIKFLCKLNCIFVIFLQIASLYSCFACSCI
jgi:hypothetical protein